MTNLSPLAQTSIERDQWREKALAAEARIAELERENDASMLRRSELESQAGALRIALESAVTIIKTWHNMGMPAEMAGQTWAIYARSAPEMQPIFAALGTPAGRSAARVVRAARAETEAEDRVAAVTSCEPADDGDFERAVELANAATNERREAVRALGEGRT